MYDIYKNKTKDTVEPGMHFFVKTNEDFTNPLIYPLMNR